MLSTSTILYSECVCLVMTTGRYKLAQRDLTRALELNPNFTDARLNLEQVKSDMNRGHAFNIADNFVENTA